MNARQTCSNMNFSVSHAMHPSLRSMERHRDDATDKSSSVGSITPTRGVSPSFQRNFMDLQHELQHGSMQNDEQHMEYVRVLESCLSGTREPASPCSRSTACSDDGRLGHSDAHVGNSNVILLGNECHNVRLEVSLHKLRTGIMGQQRLIRLHQTDTHLELEYSDAIEDLELSCIPLSPIATKTVVYSQAPLRSEARHTSNPIEPPADDLCNTGTSINFRTPWVWMTTSVISLAAVALYYRNRNPSLI